MPLNLQANTKSYIHTVCFIFLYLIWFYCNLETLSCINVRKYCMVNFTIRYLTSNLQMRQMTLKTTNEYTYKQIISIIWYVNLLQLWINFPHPKKFMIIHSQAEVMDRQLQKKSYPNVRIADCDNRLNFCILNLTDTDNLHFNWSGTPFFSD